MSALLALVPGGLRFWLCFIFWLAIAGVIEYQHHQIDGLQVSLQAEKAGRAQDRAAEAVAAASAAETNQAETARRAAAQLEITNEAQRLSNIERAAVARAATADVGLRDAFRAAAPACRGAAAGDPGPAGVSDPAGSSESVQSDVFGRLDDAAGILADFAWSSRNAGLICQQSYRSLKAKALATFADPMGHALP